ncbi:MAG: VanR-ABDEGLN family response regulator transcription factor [Firmicutes bacterium]|nr:VanR-ABDEGLN family response regulator transcription factor [Bacillota bacterium]
MKERILVVDDEKEIADLLEVYLTNDGFQVQKFYNGSEALAALMERPPDLALLDVMLPDIDGFRICQKIRENWYFPVIMLTAKVEDMDKIMGLTLGADDYITKPFNPLEVLARVKTQLRRYTRYNHPGAPVEAGPSSASPLSPEGQQNPYENEIDINGLIINKDTHTCTLYGAALNLTPIEFSILWYLCQNRGRVISSEELFEKVWGEKYLDNNNTVMAHIGRLREKLKEPARNPKFVKTVWGVGYKVE